MYGVAIDALVSQFVVGEIENSVIQAFKNESPDIIFKLIETISQTKVMAIALSRENLSDEEILGFIASYEKTFKLPTTDVLSHGCQKLVQTLSNQFPKLKLSIKCKNFEKTPALAA